MAAQSISLETDVVGYYGDQAANLEVLTNATVNYQLFDISCSCVWIL